MKPRVLAIYVVLLVVSILFLAILWHWQMAGNYFVSGTRGIILDFLPPFANPGVQGEFFVQPPRVIYTIWAVYMLGLFLLPAGATWALLRLYEKDLGRYW